MTGNFGELAQVDQNVRDPVVKAVSAGEHTLPLIDGRCQNHIRTLGPGDGIRLVPRCER